SEFGRKPGELSKCSSYKATACRVSLLYLFVALLVGSDHVPKCYEETLLLLVVGCRILADPLLFRKRAWWEMAKWCIDTFVRHVRDKVMGSSFVTYNIHTLVHLADEVRMQDMPLDEMSAFVAENEFRK